MEMINYPARIIITLCLATIIFANAGCDRHSGVSEKLDLAESLMDSRPDSALSILNAVNVETLSGKKDKARYALIKSMALDKNYIDTTSFDVLKPAIDYFLRKGKGTADEKLRTCYYQGRIYQNRENNDSAMQSFMRGREFYGQASDTMTMANLLVAQGAILYPTYKFDDVIKVNLEAAELFRKSGRHDYEFLSIANVMDCSILKKDKNLSDSVMKIAHTMVNGNPEYASTIYPYELMYAITFGENEDIENLLNHFNSADSIEDMTKIDIALAYSKIGDVYNAKRYMNLIDTSSDVRHNLRYDAVLTDILEQNGDYAGALHAYRKYATAIDSIHYDILTHDLLFAQARHEMEKDNFMKLQKRNYFIGINICIVFILLIISIYTYYRYRLSKTKAFLEEQENERLQLEQENLKKENENLELKNHQAELECERQSLAAENLRLKIEQLEDESSSLKDILDKRKDLAKPIEEAIKIRIEMLNGLLAAQITDNNAYAKSYAPWRDQLIKDKDEFMNTTRLAFKASHPRFMEYLEERGLTESEINYVCLYAIGLRGKEAGDYMQLKRHYHISSDVRKKLGIDGHQTNLGIYIRKLMRQL